MTSRLALALALPLSLLLTACGDKTDFDWTTFEGGLFQFTNTAVDDGCYDGGLSVIFMPEGTANDWDVTTELPSWADLPATYDLSLPAPWQPMEVTVEDGGDALLTITDVPQPAPVELDAATWPGCLVDVVISADLNIVDADSLTGTATLVTSSFDEASCPAVAADPCELTLSLSAARAD